MKNGAGKIEEIDINIWAGSDASECEM